MTRIITEEHKNTETINSRIAKIRTKYCSNSNTLFAKKMDLSKQTTSNLCSDGTSVGAKTINRILTAFPQVSRTWLVLGEGPMLREEMNGSVSVSNSTNTVINSTNTTIGTSAPEQVAPAVNGIQHVPCIPSGIYQRRDFDCLDYIRKNPVPRIRLSDSFGNIDLLYTVRDDSMFPLFNRGDIIGLREVPLDCTIVNGNVYLIDSRSCGLLLRMVHDLGDGIIEVVPMERNRYRPFTLEKSDVIRAFCSIYLVRTYL